MSELQNAFSRDFYAEENKQLKRMLAELCGDLDLPTNNCETTFEYGTFQFSEELRSWWEKYVIEETKRKKELGQATFEKLTVDEREALKALWKVK